MKHRQTHIKQKIKNFKPERLIIRRPIFWIIIFLLLVVSGFIYFIFFFPKFQIKTVTVSGNEKINSNNIETITWQNIQKKILGISYKTIFMINHNELKKELLAKFPGIEDVKVQNQWPQNLNLKITERLPVAVFCPNQNTKSCFLIDRNGVIYEQIENTANDNFIVRQSINENELMAGKIIVDKKIMDNIVKIKNALNNNFQIDVKETIASNPLVVTTSEHWKIYFDSSQDIDSQIIKMNALLSDEISENIRKNLQYIYLQYKDRAYYK